MDFLKTIDRINRLHRLIKNNATGTPAQFAEKLGISKASLYRLIDDMQLIDAPIEYSRRRETFYYTKEFHISINYSISIIDDENELKKIDGGCYLFPFVSILRRKNDIFVNKGQPEDFINSII